MDLRDRLISPVHLEDTSRADLVLAMLSAALTAVDPEAATRRALAGRVDRPTAIVALGKAAPAMSRGAAAVWGGAKDIVIVTDHEEDVPPGAELWITSHPIPDASSERAGRRLLEVVGEAENVVFLISGGGSALAEVPAPHLIVDELAATYALMLREGLSIEETNTVRSHLSALKGGRLAAAVGGRMVTVLVSDVISRPHLIASGPTVPCPTVPGDALDVLQRHGLVESVPDTVLHVLTDAEPPPRIPASEILVAADGHVAARAAVAAAQDRGASAGILTTHLDGAAAEASRWAVNRTAPGEIAVLAGETTVEVRGGGRGGRNQEAALAAAILIEDTPVVFASLGTDGVDGPTDAAGAIVDGSTARRIRQAGIDPEAALGDNDSYPALDAAGALIRCGPTGTNVADVWVVDKAHPRAHRTRSL